MRLRVEARETAAAARLGDSVAIAGCCLTATAVEDGSSRSTPSPRRSPARRSAGSRKGARSTSSPRCAPASRSAATSSRATSTASAASARSSPRATGARLWLELDPGAAALLRREGLARPSTGVSLDRRRARRRRLRRSRSSRTRSQETTLGALRPGRRGQPRGRRAREVRRAARDHLRGTIRADMDATERTTRSPPSRRRSRTSARASSSSWSTTADRENEGDLTIAAQFATPEAINFMATHGRGLICLCLTEERCDELRPAADDRPQRGAVRHRVHGLDRGARGHHDGHLGARPLAHDPGRDRPEQRRRTTSSSPATCSRCARSTGGVLARRARRRPPSTSRGSPGSTRPASSAR